MLSPTVSVPQLHQPFACIRALIQWLIHQRNQKAVLFGRPVYIVAPYILLNLSPAVFERLISPAIPLARGLPDGSARLQLLLSSRSRATCTSRSIFSRIRGLPAANALTSA